MMRNMLLHIAWKTYFKQKLDVWPLGLLSLEAHFYQRSESSLLYLCISVSLYLCITLSLFFLYHCIFVSLYLFN